jgi:LacI family transcriptional regulator
MGVMVPEISEGYAANVLSGIEKVLLESGYFYLVVSHHHRTDLLRDYPRLLLARGIEGLIAIDTPVEPHLPIPVVAVSGHQRLPGVTNLELDHIAAVRLALTHLWELGHRSIAFIKGQEFSSDTATRWSAIECVSRELGLSIESALCVQLGGIDAGSEPGYRATAELIQRAVSFSALFAFNDQAALGAISCLKEHGRRVPEEISVVGFDDIPSAGTSDPGLTTVRQPLRCMGAMAATALLQRLESGNSASTLETIVIQPDFIIRRSTAAPSVDQQSAPHHLDQTLLA